MYIGNPGQIIGFDQGFGVTLSISITTYNKYSTDSLHFVDLATGLRRRLATDSIRFYDSGKELGGDYEHLTFSDIASITVKIHATDHVGFVDHSLAGLHKLATDSVSFSDLSSIPLVAKKVLDSLSFVDTGHATQEGSTDRASFADQASIKAKIYATDHVSFHELPLTQQGHDGSDSLSFSEVASIPLVRVYATDSVVFVDNYAVTPPGTVYVPVIDRVSFHESVLIEIGLTATDHVSFNDSLINITVLASATDHVTFSETATIREVSATYQPVWS